MIKKTIKRYVPESVVQQIQSLNYKCNDHLYIICDMLERAKLYRKNDKNCTQQFVDIPTIYFTNIITKRKSFYQAKNFLIQNNIIECDGQYSKDGGKALGYRFNATFVSKLMAVEIAKVSLFKKITTNVNKANNSVKELLKENKEHFLNTFQIDFAKAERYIDKLYRQQIQKANTFQEQIECIHRYNAYFMSISAINDGHLFFRQNDTNYRVDTNLTSLKSELRSFITTPNLCQLDIVNSQPLFLYFLIKRFVADKTIINKSLPPYSYLCCDFFRAEMSKYLNWCRTGNFYENFRMEYNLTTNKTLKHKDEVKPIVYTILFAPNNMKSAIQSTEVFRQIFPNITRFVSEYKKNNHKRLAIDLQRLESDMCITTIVPLLNTAGIKHYTVHDAWLCDTLDSYKAEMIIKEAFYKQYKVEPSIDKKKINY